MKFNLRTATAGLGIVAMVAMCGAVLPAQAAAPDPVAQSYDYDGYCYAKKSDLAGQDAALGAISGAIAGNLLSKKGDKTKGAVIGAGVGGAAGYVVGKNSKKVRCSKGRYYVYTNGYYAPPPAPRGYKEVFFEERPDNVDLYVIKK
ncbi:MAG: YMGG-like glycine zipper-containing protein, partial [Asticcacaulis sp.]